MIFSGWPPESVTESETEEDKQRLLQFRVQKEPEFQTFYFIFCHTPPEWRSIVVNKVQHRGVESLTCSVLEFCYRVKKSSLYSFIHRIY